MGQRLDHSCVCTCRSGGGAWTGGGQPKGKINLWQAAWTNKPHNMETMKQQMEKLPKMTPRRLKLDGSFVVTKTEGMQTIHISINWLSEHSLALPHDKHWRFACNYRFGQRKKKPRKKLQKHFRLFLPAHLQHYKQLILTPE